jgi:hypothetical protein
VGRGVGSVNRGVSDGDGGVVGEGRGREAPGVLGRVGVGVGRGVGVGVWRGVGVGVGRGVGHWGEGLDDRGSRGVAVKRGGGVGEARRGCVGLEDGGGVGDTRAGGVGQGWGCCDGLDERRRGGVGQRVGGGHGLEGRGLLLDDGVEAVVIVGGVVDDASRAVGLDEGVTALDDVPVARLLLGLGVPGYPVVDVVRVAVLGVRVVFRVDGLGDDGLGHGGGRVGDRGCVKCWCSRVGDDRGADVSPVGASHQDCENNELKRRSPLFYRLPCFRLPILEPMFSTLFNERVIIFTNVFHANAR